jgi:hypothetical protein
MFGIIATASAGVIGSILAIAAFRPATFHVEREATIDAPIDRIFPIIDDFHEWPNWSPWEKIDPAMHRTHSGATRGRGAIYAWQGNKKVGSGRMEILESNPASGVKIKLDFIAPFEAHNIVDITLRAEAGGTRVKWAMTGTNNFLFRVMGLFMSMDKMVGKDFEQGLANLKQLAES